MSVDEALKRAGLHIDELNKLRVLEPEISQENVDLKEECHDFTQSKYCDLVSTSYSNIKNIYI